jgi:hypothetical protein
MPQGRLHRAAEESGPVDFRIDRRASTAMSSDEHAIPTPRGSFHPGTGIRHAASPEPPAERPMHRANFVDDQVGIVEWDPVAAATGHDVATA